MNMEFIDRVVKPLDEFIDRKMEMLPFALDNGFIPIKIDEGNFHELGLFSNNAVLVGVDGGNAEILNAPSFSLNFIRVVGVFYNENKRIDILKKEFFCFVKAENKDDKISYSVEIFGDNIFDKELNFSSEIKTLRGEKYRIEIESVGSMVRRYAELKLAESIVNNCQENTSIVVDGSISANSEEELSLIKNLAFSAISNKVKLGFLSKTCRLLTKNAYSLNSVLNEAGPKSSWFYYPVFEINNKDYLGEMYFVKLNSKANHVFRLEIGGKDKGNVEEYILSLALNSNDPIFYGYPYCLIEADKMARVSNNEKEYLRTIFLSKIRNKDKLRYTF